MNAISESIQTPDENQCEGGHSKGIKEVPAGDSTTEESSIIHHVRPKLEWSTVHGRKVQDQPLAHRDVVPKVETSSTWFTLNAPPADVVC